MNKFCGHCGAQRSQNDKFCCRCGATFKKEVIVSPQSAQCKLTHDVISKDINGKKYSAKDYVVQILCLAGVAVIAALWKPEIVLLGILSAINIIRMIAHDSKQKNYNYYVLERKCLHKEFVKDTDGPDVWRLWFDSADGSHYVGIPVKKDFYEASCEGEDFFVVFLNGGADAALCYRKSEWI